MKSLLIVAALALTLACAVSLKQTAVVAHQSAETAFGAAQDAEIALYRGGTVPQLTPQAHIQIQTAFKKVFALQDGVGAALQAWKSGAPVPKAVTDWLTAIDEAILSINRVAPPGDQRYASLWTHLMDYARQVIAVAKAVQAAVSPAIAQLAALKGAQ